MRVSSLLLLLLCKRYWTSLPVRGCGSEKAWAEKEAGAEVVAAEEEVEEAVFFVVV